MTSHHFDILIVGSGAAGASLALRLAQAGPYRIALMSKAALASGSTFWAQGGIAAAIGDGDSPAQHAEDTMVAGAGQCDSQVVKAVTEAAPGIIAWLTDLGVPWQRDADQHLHLGKEGGHSERRIVHAADATGQAIATTLLRHCASQPNITSFEHHMAIDCILHEKRCEGVYALNNLSGQVESFSAKIVVLATGGANTVYAFTTNPHCSSGDGMAMAMRAGCELSHMAFEQFHPTCLYHPEVKTFLITEAMRGEGAILTNQDGERFMPRYHVDAELAPRDVVARAIDHEMKRSGAPHVWLDVSHLPKAQLENQFPTIVKQCRELGMDITKQRIPVVPAAHYSCGGVVTTLAGLTSCPHLYAIGEVAYTGLHGANRMASNSLLECLVMGQEAAAHILQHIDQLPMPSTQPDWDASRVQPSQEKIIVRHHWQAIRQLMWNYVGIVRNNDRLNHALSQLQLHQKEIQRYYERCQVTMPLLELRNLVQVAIAMVQAAQQEKHNVGLHFNVDRA